MKLRWLKLAPSQGRLILRVVCVVAIVYMIFGAYVWHAMRQPPEDFGRVMARLPQPAIFIAFPFETLWTHARAGSLHIGDPAPDFTLSKLDKSGSIQLSSFSAQKRPVVLIFGSYT
ncbi:MAG TPA: hypothetical protein VHW45_13485 [Candidatus Sulfotelmatobacter sp.]|jgi:hypothetical protein|nr:hypothetical protein [Candidatus Sulfotelmatobacter sp.]